MDSGPSDERSPGSTPSWTSARGIRGILTPRMDAFETRSGGTSGETTGETPAGSPSGERQLWAAVDHQHTLPPLPRWVRAVAIIVVCLTLVTAGLAWVVWQQSNRISRLEDYVTGQVAERHRQRAEDTRREKLIICDLLNQLTGSSPNADRLRARLACPPPGDPAYAGIGAPPHGG
jgi:hypothetical protein